MTIRPQAKNANRHTQRGMQALETSIAEDGWIGAITIAADGETFDGSARVEKTAENGMLDGAIVIDSDGSRPIVVRRTDIATASDPRAIRLGIAANRVASLNLEWEPGVLAELAGEVDLSGLFYADELADLASPVEPQEDPPVTIDETKPTRCQLGDVWRVGRHTVACLDSTVRENIERVLAGRKPAMVWSDAPYGVSVVKDSMVGADFGVAKKGKYVPVANDDSTDTAQRSARLFLEEYPKAQQIWWGANNYASSLPDSSCWIVWDKRVDTGIENTFADCELAWSNMTSAARVYRQLWNGMIREGEHDPRIHPTQKPIALCSWAFEKYGEENDLIVDPFLGSGPSVKAAEPMGRTVVGFELSPHYIDHILEWGEQNGLEVTRIDG